MQCHTKTDELNPEKVAHFLPCHYIKGCLIMNIFLSY